MAQGVHVSNKIKNHVCSQHILNTSLCVIIFFVKSSNTRAIPIIKIQVTICIRTQITFIYSHQHKYTITLLNNSELLSHV